MLSKEKIEKYRIMLLEELNEIEERNREQIADMEKVDDESFRGDEGDQAMYYEERHRMLRRRDRDRKLINKIQATLRKMDLGTYGYCEECGEEISEDRLDMRPVASLCVECKQEQESREDRDR